MQELKLTRWNVRTLTHDNIDDLVRVYNSGRNRSPDYFPLTVQDIKALIRKGVVIPNQTFLMLGGSRPVAAARFGWNDNRGWGYITDLSGVPGLWSPVESLIDHILGLARELKIETMRTWIPSTYMKLTDILAEFTFEVRRVRLPMRTTLSMTDPFPGEEITPARRFNQGSRPSVHPPGHISFRPLDLHEARDHSQFAWAPRCYAKGEDGKTRAIGYQSKTQRGQGWLGLSEDVSLRKMDSELSVETIRGVLTSLHKDGVRSIGIEVGAAKEEKTPFLMAGFESLLTLYELELVLAYS